MTRILIICYYWPPAGGPGVQRWLKFVKYLPQFGIEPVVYIPKNPSYPLQDESLVNEIPEDVEVISQPIFEPYSLANIFSKKHTKDLSAGIISEEKKQSFLQKVMLYIRGNFFIPDARKFWVKPSVNFLENYITDNPVDAIITTGPPHSLHLIGLALKQKLGVKWIADFRDPWTTIGYHEKLRLSPKSQKKHQNLEAKVLNTADHLLVTSPSTQRDFEQKTNVPVTCITNGFDEVELDAVELDRDFTLSHIGSLLSERNPVMLWEILAKLKQERVDFAERLKIKLAGKVSDAVLQSLEEFGLKPNVDMLGYLSHQDALRAQRSTFALLLLEIDSPETQVIIPGKVFEYLAARRPVVGIGPEDSDFFELIENNGAGKCFNYHEAERLERYILELFESFKAGKNLKCEGNIEKFTRKNLTGQLAETINKIITN